MVVGARILAQEDVMTAATTTVVAADVVEPATATPTTLLLPSRGLPGPVTPQGLTSGDGWVTVATTYTNLAPGAVITVNSATCAANSGRTVASCSSISSVATVMTQTAPSSLSGNPLRTTSCLCKAYNPGPATASGAVVCYAFCIKP